MPKKSCLIDGCSDVAEAKGLCHTHYYMLYNRIKNGEFTWKELEDMGIALVPDSTKKSLKKKKQLEVELNKRKNG